VHELTNPRVPQQVGMHRGRFASVASAMACIGLLGIGNVRKRSEVLTSNRRAYDKLKGTIGSRHLLDDVQCTAGQEGDGRYYIIKRRGGREYRSA